MHVMYKWRIFVWRWDVDGDKVMVMGGDEKLCARTAV